MSFFATQPWHYLIGFGVIIGSGIGFGTIICLSTAVTRWFVRFRGRAMAIAMTASGFAGLVGAPLMNMIMTANNGNWRMAWLYVTGIAVISAIVAFMFVKERPEDLGQVPDGGAAPAGSGGPKAALSTMYDWTPAEAYRTSSFWMIVAGACACQYPFFFFTAHWIMHLRGLGISPAIYAFAMGLFTMGGIFGRLIGGWLMDRMPARYAFMLGLCCYFVGSVLAITLTKDTLLAAYAAAILYGAGFGWTFVCMNTVTGNFYGMKAFPKLNGMVMMLSAIICSPAGVIGGKLFDMFKSYTPAFELNIAIGVVGIIALIFAKMPQAPNAGNSATVGS
jgi:MFS family permease